MIKLAKRWGTGGWKNTDRMKEQVSLASPRPPSHSQGLEIRQVQALTGKMKRRQAVSVVGQRAGAPEAKCASTRAIHQRRNINV